MKVGASIAMLNTADVCVNPDIVNEMNDKSTMNKIMEYMALGKPIVQFELTEGRYSADRASLYARPNDERDFAAKIVQLLDAVGYDIDQRVLAFNIGAATPLIIASLARGFRPRGPAPQPELPQSFSTRGPGMARRPAADRRS